MALPRTYLVECYSPGVDRADVAASGSRAQLAADAMSASGDEIEYLGALLVAEDEVVFHVFRAARQELALKAARRATLPFERIVESVAVGGMTELADRLAGHERP